MAVDRWFSTCGCGARIRSDSYTCKRCAHTREFYIPQLAAAKPEYENGGGPMRCEYCKMLGRCTVRLATNPGSWILCERPDELDLATFVDNEIGRKAKDHRAADQT